MDIGNYDIEKILMAMYGIAKKCVTKVFTSERPSATVEALDRFIVISLSGNISNHLALGEATAKFELFIRDRKSGLEDTSSVSEIQRLLYDQLPCTVEDKWMFSSPMLIPIGSDGKGFHVYTVISNLIIL